jgi:hypothetical protein
MNDTTKLVNAGDVSVDEVVITTSRGFYQDITNQIIGIQIFEDIFSPFITGTLSIKDGLDLMNAFPFQGEEYLEMKISTPTLNSGNIDNKYYIFKMSNRVMSGDRATVYDLHFISEEAVIDVNKKISRSYGGKCSDIAKKLIQDDEFGLQVKRPVYIEETKNSTKFISNFWSPVFNINYLTETSINLNGSASYLFYEDRNGFNYVSMESLYRTEIYQDFIYDNYVRDILPDGTAVRNIHQDYKRIRDIKIPVAYDYIERARNGMFGSRIVTYDTTTKIYNTKNYDMLQTFNDQYHLNNYPVASSKNIYKYNSLIITMPKYSGSFSGWGDVTNASSIQNRTSLMTMLNANKVEITVPGRCDYTVGMRIQVTLYKVQPEDKTDTDLIDNMFSGSYLVTAINHYINKNTHECTMEIVKDSLLIDLNRTK